MLTTSMMTTMTKRTRPAAFDCLCQRAASCCFDSNCLWSDAASRTDNRVRTWAWQGRSRAVLFSLAAFVWLNLFLWWAVASPTADSPLAILYIVFPYLYFLFFSLFVANNLFQLCLFVTKCKPPLLCYKYLKEKNENQNYNRIERKEQKKVSYY